MSSYLVAFEVEGEIKVFETSSNSNFEAREKVERNYIQGYSKHLWSEEVDESLTEKRPLHFWLAISRKVMNFVNKDDLSNFISYIEQNKINLNQYYAIENRHSILTNIVQHDRIDFLKWLLAQKELVLDIKNPDGSTAFHHVRSYESIKLLKRAGLNIDEADSQSRTPLAKAIEEMKFDIAFFLKCYGGARASKAELNKLIVLGVKEGCSLTELKEILAMGASTNALDDNGNNLLHLCAEHDRVRLAKEIIKCGVDSKGKNKQSYTPLHICAMKNNVSVAELLFQKGKTVNIADDRGHTPIFYANSSAFVKLLIKHGADINWQDAQKRTPIYYVKDKLVCRAMLKSGANFDGEDIYYNFPIHLVKNKDVAETLMKAYGNNMQLIGDLGLKNQKGRTPLHMAIMNKRLDVAELLLSAGANPEGIDNSNNSALGALFMSSEVSDLCELNSANHYNQAVINNREFGSQEIIDGVRHIERFYPECKDQLGNTLLHYASFYGEMKVVEFLVGDLHYNLDSLNIKGFTPLHYATEKMMINVADYLLESGADLDITNSNGYLPLHIAAKVNSPEMLACLLKHGSLIDKEDRFGKTAIEYIDKADNNAKKCFQTLAENGADITNVVGSIDKELLDDVNRKRVRSRAARIKPPYSTINLEPQFGPKRQLRILLNNKQPYLNQLIEKHISSTNSIGLSNAAITWEMLPSKQSIWGETLLEHLSQSKETCRVFSKRWPMECVQGNGRSNFRPTWDAVGAVRGLNEEIKGYILLIAASSEKDIFEPAPGLAITNRLLIEKTMLDFGYKLGRYDIDRYFSEYSSSAEYRYIEREIVSNLLADALGVPVYPILLNFYDDKTIIKGCNSKQQLSDALEGVLKEVDKLKNKVQNNNIQINSIFIEAFDPPDWPEHQVCYLGSPRVCSRHKKNNQSLVKPAKDFLEQYRKVMNHTFRAGLKQITVESNVFVLPEPAYEDVVMRIKFTGVGKNRVGKVKERMKLTIQDLYIYFDSNERLSHDDRLIGLFNELENLMDSLTPDIKYLKEWDDLMDEIDGIAHRLELTCPPIYYFIRPGFFLGQPINSDSGSLVAGCYVKDDANDKDNTIMHELAHAAMNVSMEEGAVAGCRWVDEAFAEYFAQLETGFLPTLLSGCEGDVYMVWTTLADLHINGSAIEIERLLEKVLSPNLPTDICPEVLKLRQGAERYKWSKKYP